MTQLGKLKVTWRRFVDKENQIVTVSQVFTNDDRLLSMAETVCRNKDKNNPDVGRKTSLTRALQRTNLSKKERAKIWEDYRHMTLQPRW